MKLIELKNRINNKFKELHIHCSANNGGILIYTTDTLDVPENTITDGSIISLSQKRNKQ